MNKKKTGKSRATKSARNLPVKTLSARSAKGVKGGKASFHDLSFVHNIDKASPVLFQATANPKK